MPSRLRPTSGSTPCACIPAQLHLHRDQIRSGELGPERIIETAQLAGLEILAWSPGPAEAVRLVRAGADAVCVNDMPGVQAALASAAAGAG
jgi:hypothetical protein